MESKIIIVWPKGKLKINLKKSKPDTEIIIQLQVANEIIKKGSMIAAGIMAPTENLYIFEGSKSFKQDAQEEGFQEITFIIKRCNEDIQLKNGTYIIEVILYPPTGKTLQIREPIEITFIT